MIEFITVAYNGDVDRLIDSIPPDIIIHVFVHSKTDMYDHIQGYNNIKFYPYYKNRGLSNSWNEGMINAFSNGASGVVIINDDCYFSDHPDAKIMMDTTHSNLICAAENVGYSCLGVNRRCFDKMGCFDENIFPAYYEDCDYSRRLTLAGININNAPAIVFHEGSGTIKKSPELNTQNLTTMMATQKYYRKKWGALNGEETYRLPFNDPRFTYYIHPLTRHEPYPGHNRKDQHIVLV